MRKFLSLFSCWLLLSGSISQAPPAAFPDVPVITENSVGKARIGMSSQRLKAAYKGCTFGKQNMQAFGWENGGGLHTALCVRFNGVPLFIAAITEGRIGALVVVNSRYRTAKGIHIGSTAADLKQAEQTAEVCRDKKRPDLQMANAVHEAEGGEALSYCFKNAAALGQKEMANNAPTSLFLPLLPLAAPISWITVFDISLDI